MRKIKAGPSSIAALKALAQNLYSLGRPKDALQPLVKAVMLRPKDAGLMCDLADMWQAAGYFPQAVAAYQKALELHRGFPRASYSLGCALIATGEYAPAISCLQEVVAIQPDWLEARHNLAKALYEMGGVSSAFAHFQLCAGMTRRKESEHSRSMAAVIAPGVPELDNQGILNARRTWTECDLPRPPKMSFSNHSEQSRRVLRVGYISSFFHGENWMKPVWGLINQHNRDQFEIHIFSDSQATLSPIPRGYRAFDDDKFYEVTGKSNDEVARLVRKCEIDILVDLNGFSKVQRLSLFTHHPAPVVAGWFNSYGTTAIDGFDILIGDRHVIPVGEEHFYSERIKRVSGSWLTFEPLPYAPQIVDPPSLSSRRITFGSASTQYKVTDEVVKLWSRILMQAPDSRLILKNKNLGSITSQSYVHALFEQQGIARSRIQLEGPEEEYLEFLEFYNRIDVALETFPYGGATTTTDALWQGVPVITSEGDRWASRLSVSILKEAALDEFIAPNLDAYADLAIRLARSTGSPERLLALRRGMRPRLLASNVCNTQAFAREIEAIYRSCWINSMT